MMSSAALGTSSIVALPHCTRSAVWRHPVGSSHTVAVSYEWSTGPTLHCCRMPAHLAGHCPHVLQAIMARALDALETSERALETQESSCIARSTKPFFISEARGPQRAVGRMTASEPTRAGRRGPETWDTHALLLVLT
jgi:hypothetical protein